MHYYNYSALIFNKGKIRDGLNAVYKSEEPSTVIELKQHVYHFYAGDPGTYDHVVILNWEEVNEDIYNRLKDYFGEKLW